MPSRTPLPSSFELLIDELFERDDRPAAAPRGNGFSINSLEATWSLSTASGTDVPSPAQRRQPYASDESVDGEGAALLDPNKILSELGLDGQLSEADIATLRREFALRNHPDRVRPDLRELATQRMMIANNLMDQYVVRLQRKRSG